MKPMRIIKLVTRIRIESRGGTWKILKKTTLIIFKPEPLLIYAPTTAFEAVYQVKGREDHAILDRHSTYDQG
jgi:hypothetical protein